MDGKTLQFYAEHAPSLAARYAGAESTAARHFQEVFGTGGRILDVGCGSGRDLHALVEAGFDAEGVDACPAMLSEAKRRYPALADRIRQDSLPDLGTVPDASLDGVLCWAVLMHLRVASARVRERRGARGVGCAPWIEPGATHDWNRVFAHGPR